MIALLLACTGGADTAAEAGPFFDGTPSITELQWGCEVEASQWRFAITTAHWTGGGRIYMAREPTVIEEHRVRSVGAEPDGSADTLELELDIVADWRDAVGGSSTRWRCDDTDTLTFLAAVYTPDGESRADCRVWGADVLLWDSTEAVEGCQTVLEDPDTGSTQ